MRIFDSKQIKVNSWKARKASFILPKIQSSEASDLIQGLSHQQPDFTFVLWQRASFQVLIQ